MRDLGLLLEDRPHQCGQVRVDRGDLLELVEHDRSAAAAVGGDPAGQLEQSLEGRVDVGAAVARVEAEGDRAIHRIQRYHRRYAQTGEHLRRLVSHFEER